MTDRVATGCDHCGASDTAPKVHLGPRTVHHDCLSAEEAREQRDSAQPEEQVAASVVIDKCRSGVQNDELLRFVEREQSKTNKRLGRES